MHLKSVSRALLLGVVAVVATLTACGQETQDLSVGTASTSESAPADAVSPEAPTGDTAALQRCDAYATHQDPSLDLKVLGGFDTTVDAAMRHVNLEVAGRAAAAGGVEAPEISVPPPLAQDLGRAVSICYLRGAFQTPVPPGTELPDVSVTIVDGEVGYPILGGYSTTTKAGYPPIEVSRPESG